MNRQRTKAERDRFYAENPEVETWIKIKAVLQKAVVGYWILLILFQIIAKVQMQDLDGIGIQVGASVIRIVLLYFIMKPDRGWGLCTLLYLYVLSGFFEIYSMFFADRQILLKLLTDISNVLVYAIAVSMEVLQPIIMLVIAIVLTVLPKNRLRSELAEAFRKGYLKD